MSRKNRKNGRDINGIFLLDKPLGISSNKALQIVKQRYHAQKAGHTGSLDPLASGLLVICFGEATKITPYLLDADKRYDFDIQLGVVTTTGDAEGSVVSNRPVGNFSYEEINQTLQKFVGDIEQRPPMYSAVRHQGVRLYTLARQGIEVERKPRPVKIHSIELLSWDGSKIEVDVKCSKGTYVRVLAEDIGNALDCGGYVTRLRRLEVGPYTDDQLIEISALEAGENSDDMESFDRLLLPIESAIMHWPSVNLSDNMAYYMRMGQAVMIPHAPSNGLVRLYKDKEQFLGIGQVQDDGKIGPHRLLKHI